MKRLAVLRHAKSSWDQPDLEDFDRPLNERGWKAARKIGSALATRGFDFDRIVASTAVRVRETLDGVREKFALSAPIQFDSRIYLADVEQLLKIVRELPETVHRPLLVGHNPGLEQQLALLAIKDGDHFIQRVAHNFPTGAFALVDLPQDRWNRIEPGSGRIIELILPKELD